MYAIGCEAVPECIHECTNVCQPGFICAFVAQFGDGLCPPHAQAMARLTLDSSARIMISRVGFVSLVWCAQSRKQGGVIMTIKEIEMAIMQLPPSDFSELRTWFENYAAQMWDRQIEKDLKAGRLDALLTEVDQEYEAGLGQPL